VPGLEPDKVLGLDVDEEADKLARRLSDICDHGERATAR